MRIAIVQSGEENVAQEATEKLEEKLATAEVTSASADDPFDVLAKSKSLLNKNDFLVMIIGLDKDKKEMNTGFYSGLASLQLDTGKTIYKEIYKGLEEPDVEGLVEKIAEREF